jgi:hypothetical protein
MVPEYEYFQDWSFNLHDSEGFAVREGHENPPLHLEKRSYLPEAAKIGKYDFHPAGAQSSEIMMTGERLTLTPDLLDFSRLQGSLHDGYVYYGAANPVAPQPGDVRLSYYVVPLSSRVTVTGLLEGKEIKRSQGTFSIDVSRDLNALAMAIKAFESSQRWWRIFGAVILLAAYWLACWLRLRRGRSRVLALPLALVLTSGTVAAAMFMEGMQTFAAIMGTALVVGWWSAGRPSGGTFGRALDEPEKKP